MFRLSEGFYIRMASPGSPVPVLFTLVQRCCKMQLMPEIRPTTPIMRSADDGVAAGNALLTNVQTNDIT